MPCPQFLLSLNYHHHEKRRPALREEKFVRSQASENFRSPLYQSVLIRSTRHDYFAQSPLSKHLLQQNQLPLVMLVCGRD